MNEKTIHSKYQLRVAYPLDYQEMCVVAPSGVPKSKADKIRYALATLGGLASLTAILNALKDMGQKPVRSRIKDSLKDMADIHYLGAGYYRFNEGQQVPIDVVLGRWLQQEPQSEKACIAMIRTRYPHGCSSSIRRWLSQHSNIRKYDNRLHWVDQSSQDRPHS